MLESLIEALLEDESLTRGLPESEAQELINWLIGLLEEEYDDRGAAFVRELGKRIARLAQRHRVPVEALIDLVELAWEDALYPEEEDRPLNA